MRNGEYMTKSSFVKFWKSIMKKIDEAAAKSGCEGEINFTPHICRHTYATDLYYSDIDVKTAQYLLGHSSLNVTLEIYTHLDKSKVGVEIEKFNEYLSNQMLVKS